MDVDALAQRSGRVMASTLRYFAYGSNMLTRRMRASERAPSARVLGNGSISGWRLSFSKIGQDGSGKCSIADTGRTTDCVHGVIYEVSQVDKLQLDIVEGLGTGYRESKIVVTTANGEVEAMTYVAIAVDESLKPFTWYRALAVAGAVEHELPAEYVNTIHGVQAVVDVDAVRHRKYMALLDGQ